MTVLPVIVRELRASARQPFTYSLRLAGAAALLLASALFGLHYGFGSGVGRTLFMALHCTLLGATWVLVPILTADCISRERREGTLGLLFLTPLKGADIVIAKALAHGLRALTLWLAVLPVLTIPFLIGGVSWAEAAVSVVINANAMCWALSAGLLASAWSRAWLRALLLAMVLACAFLLLFSGATGWLTLHAINLRTPGRAGMYWDHALAAGLTVVTTVGGQFYLYYWGWSGGSIVPGVLARASAFSLLALAGAVALAGVSLRFSWREEPPSAGRLWLERTFCTPVLWRPLLRRWMRWKLEHNPIGWLEQRTWSGRLVTWSWLAVLMSFYSLMLSEPSFFRQQHPVHELIAWVLAGTIAASAAASFRRERESGVLELLLVSPLGEERIISGRLRGIWGQFLPVMGLLLFMWIYCSTLLFPANVNTLLVYYLISFLSLPVFGLYYSLRCRNYLTAFLLTAVVGLAVPAFLAEVIRALWWLLGPSNADFLFQVQRSVGAAFCQALLAIVCWNLLFVRLKQRAFPLERTQTT
jgi:ABC-type transport system involved in multi-copper enzyme maturation permease subunit